MKKFIRKKENFTCSVCGTKVKGTGYTDHCSNCLWSRHVDINPGDRRTDCAGLMEPIGAHQKEGEWKIEYRCQKCGHRRKNKTAPEDNFDKIIELMKASPTYSV